MGMHSSSVLCARLCRSPFPAHPQGHMLAHTPPTHTQQALTALLDGGADVDMQCAEGRTYLHLVR